MPLGIGSFQTYKILLIRYPMVLGFLLLYASMPCPAYGGGLKGSPRGPIPSPILIQLVKEKASAPVVAEEQVAKIPKREISSNSLEALDLYYSRLGITDKPKASKGEKEVPSTSVKGIRYSFIWETGFNKEKEIGDAKQVSGDWRNVRISVEPNLAGFLYVFVQVGKSKWQRLEGTIQKKRGEKRKRNQVRAFQTVEFGMESLTNRFGHLVVPFVSVVLSPTPLKQPSQKLVDHSNPTGLMTEQVDGSVYVVQPTAHSDEPFLMNIPLEG